MPVVLKSQRSAVVDALRASRNADDVFSRLRENSWERRRETLVALVEASDWKHGPAELLATFDHHAVVKSANGSLVQVEWLVDDDGDFSIGRSVVHETNTPVADLGQELMETARSAVDLISSGQLEEAQIMITTIAEALDVRGDLQRRINTEVTVRSLTRDAWWHQAVPQLEGLENVIPMPRTEGDDIIAKSVNDLLIFLKESAVEAIEAMRLLADSDVEKDIETLAQDVAEDVERAISALMSTESTSQEDEALQVYEAVMTAAPRLLSGIEFLKELASDVNDATGQER